MKAFKEGSLVIATLPFFKVPKLKLPVALPLTLLLIHLLREALPKYRKFKPQLSILMQA